MESGNGGASGKGVLIPVSDSSYDFQNSILGPLQSAYLYEESKQFFRYKSAVLVKNPALEEKYNAFRAKRRKEGYSEEDLQESYGFLLFDDVNKANALGETGVLAGNSTCTTLGDPSKGVCISMYSDCLDLNRWYHGKSGYIAIIRLTKGKVKQVLENYTQNFTAPTVGFDCHVSEQLPSVSAQTSSFLAFERTQYYMYELLDDGSNKTAQSPSAALPFAIVSFSYTDTKATLVAPQEKSEVKKLVSHYLPWKGQLQIGSQFFSVGLKSTAGALIAAKLPPVVKVDRAISMLALRQLLPRAVFETCFTVEAFLDGLYCSLCEVVPSEAEETSSLSPLLLEIKEKDLALTVSLNDGGFLILLHSSHFLRYDDTGSSASEVVQGMFVFPESRVIGRDTKFRQKHSAMPSEVLRVLPVLSYAEAEVEKIPFNPSEELCEVLAQHMQSYAALINPGLALSPSRELSIFPDHYDVPDAHKHLYSSPEWCTNAWQSFRSYLSKPASFQLPVSRASEILAAGQEERREDLEDDVYICLSSPEEAPASPVGMRFEDQLSDEKCPVNVETSVDDGISSAKAQVDLIAVPQNVVSDSLQAGDPTKDKEKSGDLIELNTTNDVGANNLLTPPTSDDLPAELIVSITSAERSVSDETLSDVSPVSTTKCNDFPFSGFSTSTQLQAAEENSLSEMDKTKRILDFPKVTNLLKTKRKKLQRGPSKAHKKESKVSIETPSLQNVITAVEVDNLNIQQDQRPEESSDYPQSSDPSKIDWRKLRRKRTFGSLSSKHKKARSATAGSAITEENLSDPAQQSLENTILMELEACPLRKKTERWDLKPVISECGRILVPHGSIDADQIKLLKDKLQRTKDKQCPEKMLLDAHANAHDTVEMEQGCSTAPETAVAETEGIQSMDGENHLQNIIASHVNPEQSILRQSDNSSGSVPLNPKSNAHSESDDTDTSPLQAVQDKHTDNLSPGKCQTKGEFLLTKLKSVLSRGKRKTDHLVTEEPTTNAQDTEPCLKRGKVDSDTVALKSICATAQGTNVSVKEISTMLSVDPLFAHALGLTPRETPDRVQKTGDQDTPQREDSTEIQEQIFLEKQPQIIIRPPSIFPRRGRIKTLKKHQGIPAEYIKKKWWLHFQTPACFASEKLKYKDCARDNSVRNTVKEKMNSACSSTDALNLLADLALSDSNDQVPPQPHPTMERKPETSLKKCDLTKDLTSAEKESVLHALLRQPVARSNQPPESPSPSHRMGDSELVGLVAKEHAYSLPPSSFLLLGLPGTPFQVSPLSGSARLLDHHQTMYGDGIKTLHPSVSQEDRSEHNHRTPEYLKKQTMARRKFRHCRTIVNKEGSVQVTREWQGSYDFNLDSKITSDSKEKAVIRALHGSWDASIEHTIEEVRLIIHMWIGLFYSRSTARLFHVDSSFAYPCSEENDSKDIPSGVESGSADSELKADSLAAFPSATDTSDSLISEALDLTKKDNTTMDEESVILDLSLRSSNATITSDLQVNRKETSVTSDQKKVSEALTAQKSPAELQECHKKMVHSPEIAREVNDVRNVHESKRTGTPTQKAVCAEHTIYSRDPAFNGDGTFTLPQEEMEGVSVEPETVRTASGISQVLHGCNKESTDLKDGTESSETTEKSFLPEDVMDLSTSVTDVEDVDASVDTGDEVHTGEHDRSESKDGESCKVKENPCQEDSIDLSPNPGDDSVNKESDIVCNKGCSEIEKLLSAQAQNVNGDVDCCTRPEGEVIKNEDYVREKDGLHEKDSCILAVETDGDLSDHPLSIMSEGSDLIKEDCIVEWNDQAHRGEQPPLADSVNDNCHDPPLKMVCANDITLTDKCAISERLHTSAEIEPVYDSAAEEHFVNGLTHLQKAELPTSDKSACSLDDSCSSLSVPQTEDGDESVDMGNQIKQMSHVNCGPSSYDHKDQEAKSSRGEEKVDNTTQNEPLHHHSLSPQCEFMKTREAEVAFTEETDLETNEALDSGVVIPFIGIDLSRQNIVQSHGSHPQDAAEAVQSQERIPFISETTYAEAVLPNGVCSPSLICSKKEELSLHKMLHLNVNDTKQSMILGSESDNRCPTPTMDEKPYEYIHCSSPSSSTSAFSGNKTSQSITQKCLTGSSTPVNELCFEKNLCHTSTVNSDPNPHHGLPPDLELRTLRVLQSIDKFLSISNHSDKSSQMKTAGITKCFEQTSNPSSKYTPTCPPQSHDSADFEDTNRSNERPAVVSASTSQDLPAESSNHFLTLTSPFKNKVEEVLGVKLQLKKTDPSILRDLEKDKKQEPSKGQDCHSHSSPSAECLQMIQSNIDKDTHKTTSQSNLNHESRSYSQRPVMAVKPSKSDESQTDYTSKGLYKNKQSKAIVITHTIPTSTHLEKKTEVLKENSKGLSDKHEASELCYKSAWLPDVGHSKSNSEEAKSALLDSSYQYQGRDISKFNTSSSSSPSMQCFHFAKSSPELGDGNQGFMNISRKKPSFVERAEQTPKENIEVDENDCSDASPSFMDHKDDSARDGGLVLGPQSSLLCTVYNSNWRRSYCFLEHLTRRCQHDDLTQASMEQECLIFSEQMKQLLKKSGKGPIRQEDTHENLRLSCASSPVTVQFSSLEEQEDSLDHLDMSFVGQKIKVDMSDRKDLTDTTEEERTSHPQESSQGTGTPMEYAGVSGVTAECASLYKATMRDVCAVKKVPSRPKNVRVDRGYPKPESSNHFDFCNQMKREMDQTFRSNLNSVVKKSCKTKYRFYILVTSDDIFFEETKVQLEAEGHTAVQPSEFFLFEDSSSLLIILRNEDIAEHICEVPHLLELKKTPGVQFVGIDEPDDVVNLTHQELFTRGGFIMLDRATLEPLSLCNMKKISEILQELSRVGKWKWMLHYRDSRRLKENARLSAEAKEKKHFLYWGQDTGILEVLPYHECDLMSRDQPDYLACLVRLQVQNISSRYPVFIADTTTDSNFEKNGILTITLNSFLTESPSEMFTV